MIDAAAKPTWDVSREARARRLRAVKRMLYADITTMAHLTGHGRVNTTQMLSGTRPISDQMLHALKCQGISADFLLFGDLAAMEPALIVQLSGLLERMDADDAAELATRKGRKPKAPAPAATSPAPT